MALQFPTNISTSNLTSSVTSNINAFTTNLNNLSTNLNTINNTLSNIPNLLSPGELLSSVSSLAGGSSPNVDLFLTTFEQFQSLRSPTPLSFSTSNVSVKSPEQLRSDNLNRPSIPEQDFAANNGNVQPNPLRSFNHYNYIITLGILSTEQFNRPNSYRQSGFDKIILRSGGGQLDKRQQIPAEQGGHAEYYIDNLNIDAVIGPNPNTGISLGTTIEFEVIEPYSMGKFTEALIEAAISENFTNFTSAPFCLRIDFLGWDDFNQSISVTEPYYIPINFINVEFSVSNSGSKYEVKAIATNDVALSNVVNEIKTEISTSGTVVHEILENTAVSVTNAINDRTRFVEDQSIAESVEGRSNSSDQYVPEYDKFIIAFPTTADGIIKAIEGGVSIPNTLSIEEELAARLGVPSISPENREGVETATEGRRVEPSSGIYNVLKAYAFSNVNEIGNSKINADTAEGSNQDMIRMIEAFRLNDSIIRRNTPETDVADQARALTFLQGDKITQIIEAVVLKSEYIKNSTSGESDDNDLGTRKWIRIDTYAFIEENLETQAVIGRKPRVYVYAVYPYDMDQAIHAASNASPPGSERLRSEAIKEYNYIYTGKNEDVLNFDINFNYAFLQAAFADFGNLSGSRQVQDNATSSVANPVAEPNTDNNSSSAEGSPEATRIAGDQTGPEYDSVSGTANNTAEDAIAKSFHSRLINSHVDMLMTEMTIWGDPYFLPSINGNYVPRSQGQTRMLTTEGRINYLQNDVFIVVNFLTPIDYRQEGALMEFAELEEKFSGLYRVLSVRNMFDNGQFKQELKLIRRHNQNAPVSGGAISRTSSDGDYFDPYASSADDPRAALSNRGAGLPSHLPQFGGGSAGQLLGGLGPLTDVLGQFSGAINQVSGAAGQLSGAINQVSGIVQSPQEIFQSFASVMPPQVLDFQSRFGQIKGQVATVRSQIDAASKTIASTQQLVSGAFSGRTGSFL
jgi:hypothetical protein